MALSLMKESAAIPRTRTRTRTRTKNGNNENASGSSVPEEFNDGRVYLDAESIHRVKSYYRKNMSNSEGCEEMRIRERGRV